MGKIERLSEANRRNLPSIRKAIKAKKWGPVHEETLPGCWNKTYTVGLATLGVPELIVYGLDPQDAQELCMTMAQSLLAIDKTAATRKYPHYRALPVFPSVARRVVPLLDFLFPKGFNLFQITWPDANGYHPGDQRFAPDLRSKQPQIWGLATVADELVPLPVLAAEIGGRFKIVDVTVNGVRVPI